ncbi:hypothetical protein [Agromyces kandeliae]|uniref:Uncharacterized protein n=1 Tax=Agromyces kandeliae TaxID=2666141 RepID=A0A6L5R5K3_9MICO|nr:hypothetical protein [Agromyces kandeliae]MRX45366.1 hypothetical protein [Agromyces kandeliae]
MSVVTEAATRSRADAAALRASAARDRAAAADAARADFADLPRAAELLADSPRAAAARLGADAEVSGASSPGSDRASEVAFAEARFAAAADAGRLAAPEDAAGFRALEVRFAAGLAGSAAVVSVASSAAVVARAADARFAAVERVAADLAAVDFVDDLVAADLDAEAFAALERAAADLAAVVRPAGFPPARADPSRPCSDATDSPRRSDTPVSVPSGVSSSGADRETEVTTTTYQPPRPQPWTSHSEFTSWRSEPPSWA